MPSNTRSPRSRLAADISALTGPLRELVSDLEPRDIPLSLAPEVMSAFAEVERLAQSGRILMTARAAEARGAGRERFATDADWLADQLGTTTGRARADLETSELLGELGATADAVRAGLLSPEQAAAVSDAATVNPDAERDLIDRSQRDSLRRTKQEAERRKAEARSEAEKAERDARVRRERTVRFWYSGGAGHLQATGPVAALKELQQLLEREVDKKFRTNKPPATRESRNNYMFDALVGRVRGGGGASSKTAPLTRMTLIRVDLAALTRGQVQTGELCEIGGVCVSVTELRKLLGESLLHLVLTNGEAVIDVINLKRKPSVAQMLAKLFVDSTCCVEGCDRAARLEFDHRDDWARTRTTELANLDLLCDHHHDQKTYDNWQLVGGTGRRPMVPPDDPRHPTHDPTLDPALDPAHDPALDPSSDPSPPTSGFEGTNRRLATVRALETRSHEACLAGQGDLFDTG